MSRRRHFLAIVGAAVICAPGGLAVAVAPPSAEAKANDRDRAATAARAKVYQGDAAIERLGERLPQVAAAHGVSATQLRNKLRTDSALALNDNDQVFWLDTFATPDSAAFESSAEQGFQGEQDVDAAEQFPNLHSDPGQTNKIYLDFDGGTYHPGPDNAETDTSSVLSNTVNIAAFSGGSESMYRIWQRVAEDWAPFNVDVTTERPAQISPGLLVSVGGDPGDAGFPPGVGGVAPWTGGSSQYAGNPKIVFTFSEAYDNDESGVADTISHEGGHIFGLDHDGPGYYPGHGTGATSWSPIMGNGSLSLSQWSKGEYPGADNHEDDIARITSDLTGRADDNSAGQALGGSPAAVDQHGLIETASDTDDFWFDTGGGPVSFTIVPGPQGANLDAQLRLLDNSDNLKAEANDPLDLGGTIAVTLAAGRYHLRVDGVGDVDPGPGYSDYDSLGQYRISGSYSAPTPRVSVSAWSAKRGSTKIGRRAWVTPTKAMAGATVRYRWTVGGRVVDRDRYLKIKRAWRGKTVSMKIIVSKTGYISRSKVLRYRRVHR